MRVDEIRLEAEKDSLICIDEYRKKFCRRTMLCMHMKLRTMKHNYLLVDAIESYKLDQMHPASCHISEGLRGKAKRRENILLDSNCRDA